MGPWHWHNRATARRDGRDALSETTIQETVADGAPLNLYLELEHGALADMEVVGRVSVAFVTLVREVAFIIDPSLEIRVQLQSGTEGSLSLNTLLADLKDPATRKKTLIAVAIAIGIFFGPDLKSYVVSKVIDNAVDTPSLNDADKRDIANIVRTVLKEQHQHLSIEEKAEVQETVERAVRDNVARPQRQEVFRQISRDPQIKSVGASNTLGKKPAHLIPRTQFSERAGEVSTSEIVQTTRERPVRMWVTLVSPVLTEGRRRWKIRINGEEHGAYFDDAEFVQSVLAGRATVPMRANVELDVSITLHETLVDGEWKIGGHQIVTTVHAQRMPGVPDEQLGLPGTE